MIISLYTDLARGNFHPALSLLKRWILVVGRKEQEYRAALQELKGGGSEGTLMQDIKTLHICLLAGMITAVDNRSD